MKIFKKILSVLLCIVFVVSVFCGCAKTEATQTNTQNAITSEGSNVIMRTGNLASMNSDIISNSEIDGFSIQYYDDLNSLILALKSDKIDSIYMLPEVVARYIENNTDGVKAIEPLIYEGTEPSVYNGIISLSMGTLKENSEVYNLLNDAIDKLINNGTVKKLQDEYLDNYLRTKEEPKPIDMPILDGAKTLKIAVTGDMPPIDFVATDGRPAGFNVALLSEISKLTNTNIELIQMNSAARLMALKTNAVDAVFYAFKNKIDNSEIQLDGDIPDEIIITEPYYTSRIYEVDTIESINKSNSYVTKNASIKKLFTSGVLSYASTTEEEENVRMTQYGWGIDVKFFDNLNSMLLALRSGLIDNIALLPKSTAEYIKARHSDVVLSKRGNDKMKYNMATLEKNKEVFNIFNDTLNDIIKDGTIKNIEKKYIDGFIENKDEPEVVDMPHFDGAKKIKIAVTGDLPPFDFVSADGKPAGYNVALLSEIANRAKLNIELVTMDENAKITALVTKNIDAIFWISNYEFEDERNIVYDCPKGVILTDCYYEDSVYNVYPIGGKLDKMFSGS